ncbi:MAG: hypothetical protein U0Q16_19250 [Bryobacteraceae bacterium]
MRSSRRGPLNEEFRLSQFLAIQKQQDTSWRAPGGTQPAWVVEDGWLNPRGMALYQPSAGAQNGLVGMNVRFIAGAAGLMLRAQDFRNYYTVRLSLEGETPSPEMLVEAARVENGKETIIHEERVPRGLEGIRSMYPWTMTMDGDFFAAFIGNSPIASWRDKKLDRGAVGMTARDGDMFRVYSSSMQLA